MFSSRTRWEQTPNPLSEAWAFRLAAGSPSWDLTESNPTRCGFRYPEAEILQALADPRALRYEPAPLGLRAAREALAAAHSTSGNPTAPDRLTLTASTSEAYGWLFKLLCDRGDAVLSAAPSYPLFDYLAALEDVTLQPYPLRYDGRWSLDLEALRAAITPRTRAVVVVHPNNPTGNLLTLREADALREICADRGLALISDEVFLDYPFASASPLAAGSLSWNSPCLAFSLGGLSKAAALPQIKVGWIRAGGPEALVGEAMARIEVIADTYLSVNTPAQWALPSLLRLGTSVRDQILARTRANRAWLAARHDARSSWELLHADGGWYAVLRVPRIRTEEQWCVLLIEEEGVLLHPGYFFDFESEAYLVASLLPEEGRFQEAMARALARVERG